MAKVLLKLLQYVYCVYAILLFAIIMLLAFPFIMIAVPFGIKGGNFIYIVCKIWARTWYLFVGIQHKEIFETPHNNQQQYIFVANHISYMDIPPIVCSAKQPIRVLGKYEMVKVPIFGWIYRATVILVDRRDAERRSKSVRALKAAVKQGISIFIFPEGTFNETEKPLKEFYDGAFRIAIETQTPIKPLLFIDAIHRLHYKSLFELTPGPNTVVFLAPIEVNGLTMQDLATLKQQVYNIMEAGLLKYQNLRLNSKS
ncbi:MAG TPA: lysophospholipid acyltransferase family protein [Chitinophagaceae bacterium]|jgi:1-acyl-sn-glycerol-3-phosphate acyltransferase|nr:lysophospholipid acyltransferase family protein [Chitinophagaceae bacterium]